MPVWISSHPLHRLSWRIWLRRSYMVSSMQMHKRQCYSHGTAHRRVCLRALGVRTDLCKKWRADIFLTHLVSLLFPVGFIFFKFMLILVSSLYAPFHNVLCEPPLSCVLSNLHSLSVFLLLSENLLLHRGPHEAQLNSSRLPKVTLTLARRS